MDFLDGEKFEQMAREYHKKYSNIAVLGVDKLNKDDAKAALESVGNLLMDMGTFWQKCSKNTFEGRIDARTKWLESAAQDINKKLNDLCSKLEIKICFSNQNHCTSLRDCSLCGFECLKALLSVGDKQVNADFVGIANDVLSLLCAFFEQF